MPTITLNKPIFEKLVGKTLPIEQLKDRISMLGTDLESIENDQINVEIFPNRPDLLSEQGFARAFSSFIGVKTGLRNYTAKPSKLKVIVDKSVTMRPYTACAIVKNLKFDDEKIREIMQIQEKLATTHGRNRKKSAYGIYPLNAINFPIKYIAKDPKTIQFQPLGFTYQLTAEQVLELHPKGKAYAHLTKDWTKYPFFIDAKDNVMCMLPFTNSHTTGKVEPSTTEVFIECSGTDLHNVMIALNILTTSLIDMGGQAYTLDIVYQNKTLTTPKLAPQKMKLDSKYINNLLGTSLTEKQFKHYLERMGFGYQKSTVLIPCYRNDIWHQADLAEDIAIAYGYENFTELLPNAATIGQENPLEQFMTKCRELLVGFGSLEIKNYHLSTIDDLNTKMLQDNKLLMLKNALGDYNHLRNSLLPTILKTLTENQHHEYPQKVFEIGRTFATNKSTDTSIKETETLSLAIAHETADFTEIRQLLDSFLALLNIPVQIKETTHSSFIPGRVASIIVNNQSIGHIGELHPQVLTNWNLFMPTVVFEVNVEKLFEMVKNKERKII